MRTLKLTCAWALRQTYILIWPYYNRRVTSCLLFKWTSSSGKNLIPPSAISRVRFRSKYLYSNFCYFIIRQRFLYAITLQKMLYKFKNACSSNKKLKIEYMTDFRLILLDHTTYVMQSSKVSLELWGEGEGDPVLRRINTGEFRLILLDHITFIMWQSTTKPV